MFTYLRLELRVEPVPGPNAPPDDRTLNAPLLRRVLGLALVERFCSFGEPRCQSQSPGGGAPIPPQNLCYLAASCPYGILFAASRTRRPPFALFVPPSSGKGAWIELTLYGPACQAYAWVLTAVADALRRGLGRSRRQWSLREVWRTGPNGERDRLCGPDLALLPALLPPSPLELSASTYIAPALVEASLRSPTRLLRQGRLLRGRDPVPFQVLIARILDRFKDLFGPAADTVLDARLRTRLESEATQAPLLLNETDWLEVKDYSARANAELLLGGKVGRLVYGPAAARFLPILQAGEILHVGKNATSGCGRVGVRVEEGGG
jgi:hypothetical protein